MKVNTKIPVIFQKLDDYDSRFMRVKIWLMHLEQNYNGSYFSKEVVEKAIPSLADTPILGYIEVNRDEPDFSDHRMRITIEKDNVEYEYLGQAFGTIPQDNNAKFETRVGDDGIERTYLTVEGILWRKWNTPIEIMNRDGIKSQSMELHDDYKGKWDESGLFHFEDFKFFGACILGEGVMPAMNSASVEVKNFTAFDMEAFQKEVQEKLEEFKVVFSKYQSPNGDDINKNKEGEVMNEKLVELLAKFSLTEEVLQEKEFKLEDYSTEEELEAKISQIAEEIAQTNHSNVCEKCGQAECSGHEDEEPKTYTEVEYNEMVSKYDELLEKFNTLSDNFDVLNSANANLEALTQEVTELREFKSSTLAAQREAEETELFERFSEQLTEEEIGAVKEKSSSLSIEDIEKELFSIVGKKTATFSKKPAVKVVFGKKEEKDFADYSHILEKHNK
jgi:hypothetical protein